jgi:hypothetical protein
MQPLSDFQKHLQEMEVALASAERGLEEQSQIRIARDHLAKAITDACGVAADFGSTALSHLLDTVTRENKGRRESAILVIRALSVEGFLPFEEDQPLERKVVALVEAGFGDQCRNLNLTEKRQTYEKVNVLKGFHETICSNLQVLRELPSTLAEIDSVKADIFKALRYGLSNAYLQPYDWTALRGKITHVCEQIADLVECKDSTYKARFDQLRETCRLLRDMAGASASFLSRKFVVPFSDTVDRALQALQKEAVDDFNCAIEPRRKPPHVAEKRYPLHQVDKLLTITVPLINTGPGMAVDVTIELDCGNSNSLALENPEIVLGDIPPGEFAVSFRAMVVEPVAVVDMAMMVSWSRLFGATNSIAVDVRLTSQDPSVDWERLEQLDPYSLEVAEGDKFVGRTAKVQAIGNRLLKAQMSSTYITGQKRIGKTSLAQAVLRYVSAHAKAPITYETFYLEWGEYCAADAASTVKALGEQLYAFLRPHLPTGVEMPAPVFEGSLAPLNVIAKLLESTRPEKRFIIVLDEFDEIHLEMYRYGALAEAFFANLRTLGARKNLAFILVGGEKMPFIIGAQGDQLNKFGREPLDYFSRSDEWTDYVELVVNPVRESLNWEESALNELFSLTNGHPYYTKLLCAKIFATAVAQRDTEIIVSDVRHALNGRVSELDTNAFAHFWKDGINSERDEAEVIELKRLRVLVAFGRAFRLATPTKTTIAQNVGGSILDLSNVGPIVEDFCRRDIMKEVGGDIAMQLPIFQRWIRDVGISKLIASTLADELESELQKANDTAYVGAGEIEAMVKDWPLYRGHEITGEAVRAWLDQVHQVQEQRLLFTLLQNLRFVTTPQIAEQLRYAHERVVARATPPRLRENKVEKRRDLLVTYLDGVGKSGTAYARIYAKENDLLMECVVEPSKAARRLASDGDPPNAVVVVDDLAGTGGSIVESLGALLNEIGPSLIARGIPLFLIILFATEDAELKIRSALSRHTQVKGHMNVCEILTEDTHAFRDNSIGFWKEERLRDQAKALCIRLGSGLYKDPLGFGSQSLMIAFPDTCPNNCLPIIFASRSGANPWAALLQRPTS